MRTEGEGESGEERNPETLSLLSLTYLCWFSLVLCWCSSIGLGLPAFISHTLPMLFAYVWLSLPFSLLMIAISKFFFWLTPDEPSQAG